MGAWGAAVFSDDTALDVREAYRDLLSDGLDDAAATDALLARSKDMTDDADEGPVFWVALALTQHKLGRLEERVRREALRAIDEGLALDRWREAGPAQLKARQAALAKARAEIVSRQPPAKLIRPRFKDRCEFDAGELVGYKLASGDYVVLHMLGPYPHDNGVGVVLRVLDWVGPNVPDAADLTGCEIRTVALTAEWMFRRIVAVHPLREESVLEVPTRIMLEAGLIDS